MGETTLDAARPVIRNLGAIPAGGHPTATASIREVIRAGAAIPAAFPPVPIPVRAVGRVFDEMHLDVGATRQVQRPAPPDAHRRGVRRRDGPTAVRLGRQRTKRPCAPMRRRPIAGPAISGLIAGDGLVDVGQTYAIAGRDEAPIGIVSIPPEVDLTPAEPLGRDDVHALAGGATASLGAAAAVMTDDLGRARHMPSNAV